MFTRSSKSLDIAYKKPTVIGQVFYSVKFIIFIQNRKYVLGIFSKLSLNNYRNLFFK